MSKGRIVFLGTSGFAVASLNALAEAGYELCAVVTAPDRPAGRGRQLRSSPVKTRASELQLPILQPEKLRDPAFIAELDRLAADLYVVVAFRMLPELVWTKPRLGTINLHASLLPDYRGAAPINWVVINGEKRTGVTTFKLSHEIDTGDILLQEATEIGENETAGELHDRLMAIGAALLARTVNGLFAGTVDAMPQGEVARHHAPKLDPETCRIDWNKSACEVHDFIRGLSPIPGAWTQWIAADQPPANFKLLGTRVHGPGVPAEPGSVSVDQGRLLLRASDGWLEAVEVQPEGKRRMEATAFVNGLRSFENLRVL